MFRPVVMPGNSEAFHEWIRGASVSMNTELEKLYFGREDRADVARIGDAIKAQIRDEGHLHVVICVHDTCEFLLACVASIFAKLFVGK